MKDYQPKNEVERDILGFMKKHPEVTTRDIVENCAAGVVARQRAMSNLRRAGVVRFVRRENRIHFWSVFDLEDTQTRAAQKRSGKFGAMWVAMRTLSVFSPEDIMIVFAGSDLKVTISDIQSYCSALVQAKYLAVITRARPGVKPARYRLIKNSGPLPPLRKRVTVLFDPNEDRIVFANGERI